MATAEQPQVDLKRLQPVAGAAVSAANLASRLYSTSKAYVPERLAGTVAAAESRVAAAAQPYVPALLDKGTSALQAVDAKVDGAIASAWQSYAANASFLSAAVSQRKDELAALAGPGLEHFSEARRAYLKRVEEGVAAVRAAGLEGAARAAADALAARVEEARRVPTALLGSVEAAWAQFVGMPAVGRVLAASRGQVEAAAKTYQSAHSALVADPRYSAAVARGGALLQSLQASGAYQAAQARLAPFLAPATQLAAPYVQAVATHLAPVPASA